MKSIVICKKCNKKKTILKVEEFAKSEPDFQVKIACIGKCKKNSIRAKVNGEMVKSKTKKGFMRKLKQTI